MEITPEELKDMIREIIQEDLPHGETKLGDRWINGTLYLQPRDTTAIPKEIPIETFFHKIVMLRDRLRVLEQNINAHKKLTDEEKIHLQQYITKIYGTLTTFNVLFDDPKDNFSGESGKRDS